MYKKILILLVAISLDITAFAQGVNNMVWGKKLDCQIEALTNQLTEGRAPGSKGSNMAAFWIVEQFKQAGLLPLGTSYSKSFFFGEDKVGHNIIGMIPGSTKSPKDKYVIVAAHYDHIGKIGGTIYPGADSNASGVAALVNIASMLSYMKTLGRAYNCSVIFVALDAKEASMAGSNYLYKQLERGSLTDPVSKKAINIKKVKMFVDIDQIGSSLSPLKSGREDYIIMLGNHTMPKQDQDIAHFVNRMHKTNLEIAFDYYGSARFTELFFKRLTDLKPFVENDVPSILFTSGITMKTNKPDDNISNLNLDVLSRRIVFMFHWIENML